MSDKKTTIFVSIVSVALFIVVVVAASYSYYVAVINKTGDTDSTSVSTALAISAHFAGGPEVVMNDMIPGDSFTKEFTLENTGKATIKYKIVFQEVDNTFTRQEDIIYELYEVKEDGNVKLETPSNSLPNSTNALSNQLSIVSGEKKSYLLKIDYFNQPNIDQFEDMGKSVSGKLFIEEE